MTDPAPDTQDGNPFTLIAYVLFKVRHALEDREEADRPPRWVRIARSSPYKDDIPLGPIVSAGVNGMAETLSYMVELTLDIEEILYQTDAAKATGEVMLRLVEAASDATFQAGIETLVGSDSLGELGVAMDTINSAAGNMEQYLDYIPDPEDVHGMGHELYRLLCIVQKNFPRMPDNSIDTGSEELAGASHLVMDDCGKVRLCTWAYGQGVIARGLGAGESSTKELFALGARRLYPSSNNSELPQFSALTWGDGEEAVRIVDIDFASAANEQRDIKELVELLQAHGYNTPVMNTSETVMSTAVRDNLMQFQAINALPITGELDNDTLNRLINLDFQRKNLRRALPYNSNITFPWTTATSPAKPVSGDLMLINEDAEKPEDEAVETQNHPQSLRRFYVVPETPATTYPADASNWPQGRGWLHEPSFVRGFVALSSRGSSQQDGTGRLEGGIWSEGEAAHGQFFWAARHVTPWVAGRQGVPDGDALFDGAQPPPGDIARMYQWIPMPAWLDPNEPANQPDNTGGWELYVYASVLQRSLFTDRGLTTGVPDQGRLALEFHHLGGVEDTTTPPSYWFAIDRIETAWFPNHAATTAAMTLDQVDRKRLWTLRKTDLVEVPVNADPGLQIKALCLVAEGKYQSGYDIDAYFDDFRVGYVWKKTAA